MSIIDEREYVATTERRKDIPKLCYGLWRADAIYRWRNEEITSTKRDVSLVLPADVM